MAKETKSEKGLAKRVSNIEREMKQMRSTVPIAPEQRANMEAAREAMAGERADYLKVRPGNADYHGPVGRDMARLQGRSRNDLVPDHERGAASPIGHGTGSKRRW